MPTKEYRKAYYEKNKDKIRAKAREAAKKRPYNFEANAKWSEKNYERSLWLVAKSRAKKKNIIFDIEVEDIVIPEVCPYFDVPLTRLRRHGRVHTNASLDRIDPTKGYVKGNIEIISNLANRMKNDATSEELISFAKGVLAKYGCTS